MLDIPGGSRESNAMTDHTPPSAPWARSAGLIYVGTIVTGVFATYVVRGAVIVRGDAAATAMRLVENEALFRMGIMSELAGTLCYVAVTALFYDIFRPVSRRLSLLAACFSLSGCAVGAANLLTDLAPLVLLQPGASYLSAVPQAELRALAYAFIRLAGPMNAVGLLFFGIYCALIGTLILKSTFLPRLLGVLMLASGMSWLVRDAAVILVPGLAAQLDMLVLLGIAGEASLTLWLLTMGVNVVRWQEAAAAR